MKKNVLAKLLLLSVVVMLLFALVACNKKDNTKVPVDPVDTTTTSSIDKIVTILRNANGIITTINGIKEDSTIGLDAGVGLNVTYPKNEVATTTKVDIVVKGNMAKASPELYVGVQVDEKDYAGIGYQNGNLYLLEGLNLVNNSAATKDTAGNKIKLNASALTGDVDHIADVAMKYLEYYKVTINFDTLGTEIENSMSDFISDDMINSILEIDENSDGSGVKLSVNAESLKEVLPFVGSLISTYTDYFDKAMSYLGITVPVDSKDVPLTFKVISENYLPDISVTVGYADNTISKLSLNIAIDALKFGIGADVNLDTFSTSKKADLTNTFGSYTAQDLTTGLYLNLGKGLTGKLDLVANTADAFKTDGNLLGGAKFTINNAETSSYASFDGKTLYMDISDAFTQLGIDSTGYTTKYKYVLDKSIITMINEAAAKAVYVEPKASTDTETKTDSKKTKTTFNIWNYVYDAEVWALKITPRAVTVVDEKEVKEDVDQAKCVAGVYSVLGKYLKFIDENDTTFSGIATKVVALYTANKSMLTDSLYANGTSKKAGVYLTKIGDNEINGGIIDFVGKFIKIPAISYDENAGKYVISSTEATEIASVETLKNYIHCAFGLYPADGEFSDIINENLVEKICGSTVDQILASNLYIGVGAKNGLDGYIEIATAPDATSQYAELGMYIAFAADSDTNITAIPDATELEATTNADAKLTASEGEEISPVSGHGEYYLSDAAFGLLYGAINYTAAE